MSGARRFAPLCPGKSAITYDVTTSPAACRALSAVLGRPERTGRLGGERL